MQINLGSGNILVDLHDYYDNRTMTCPDCNGDGSIPWEEVKDGYEAMADEVAFRIHKRNKSGFPCLNFRTMLNIAREVKKSGKECLRCCGTGEVS
jgi:hypothetical protein